MAISSRRGSILLKAILRPQTTTRTQHPFHQQLFERTVFNSTQCMGRGHSLTFGAETDEMIESYVETTKSRSASAGKAKGLRSRIRSSSPTTGSIEITLSDEDGHILAVKEKSTTKDGEGFQSAEAMSQDQSQIPRSRISHVSGDSAGNLASEKKARRTRLENKSTSSEPPPTLQRQPIRRLEPWQIQKDALKKKFGEANWNPRRRLSPDAIQGLRDLHAEDPERYSTSILADRFKISPEAIRRILKSKWQATAEEMDDRRRRWARRHDRIWDHKAALGQRPPRQTARTPEGPEAFEEELRAKQMLGQI